MLWGRFKSRFELRFGLGMRKTPAWKKGNFIIIVANFSNSDWKPDFSAQEEINKKIGSDRLFYQTLEDLVESILMDTGIEMEFDSSCFDGKYVTGNITEDYLKKLFDKRNDNAKQEDSDEDQGLDLHNDSAWVIRWHWMLGFYALGN